MKIQDTNIHLYGESRDRTLTSYTETGPLSERFRETVKDQVRIQTSSHMTSATSQSETSSETDSKPTGDLSITHHRIDRLAFRLTQYDCQCLTLMEILIARLTGRDIRFFIPERLSVNGKGYSSYFGRIIRKSPPVKTLSMSKTFKASKLTFSAHGSVTTSDGRQIDFDFHMSKARFALQSTLEDKGTDMTDPLVISFDGRLPALSDSRFSFDIDHDGTADQISFLTGNSGFLALDRNGDGRINNGSELFGTHSGSGFKDLAVYDGDGNGWIDENDPIFDGLRIWMKDPSGTDRLIALGEKGIGAIYLGSVSSDFDLFDRDESLTGRIRESGIYLKENGQAGNLHHLDLKR